MKNIFYFGLVICLLLTSCSKQIPKEAVFQNDPVSLSPDYTALTIPYNITPLNFNINEDAQAYLTRIYSGTGKEIIISGKKVCIDEKKWKNLLSENKGDTLLTEIYLKKKGQWLKYPAIKNLIAPDEIDNYISYRLIEPSYVTYEVMTISQRNLTNFKETVIYNNALLSDGDDGQCANCHSYQNYYKTGNMQMHVRQRLGGTVIATGDKVEKVNLKTDHTISPGVYPSWHPTEMLIAYSTNSTGQNFHTKDPQKVEVLDTESDLILYDLKTNEVFDIANDKNELETFPYWSVDGKCLYYVSAHFEKKTDDIYNDISVNFQQIKYNIFRKPFDVASRSFGTTDTIFMASDYEKSATFPRESPDGKYLLFTLGDYGNFHTWHKSSDLYLMNLHTKEVRSLQEVNSPDVESYHSWSSNGRWIIFSSRRDDGSYTRPYIAYFDKNGKAHKPFILPQQDPDFYTQFFKSYNIPEFMVKPVKTSTREFVQAIEKSPKNAIYHNPEQKPVIEQNTNEKDNFYD